MTRRTYAFLLTFMLFATYGLAQVDSSSFKDTLKQLNYFYPNHFSLQTDKLFPSRGYTFETTYFNSNSTASFFCRPVYYNLYLQRDFSYKFNALNPWNAHDPFEAIMSGSINYLFQTVDRKYFLKK